MQKEKMHGADLDVSATNILYNDALWKVFSYLNFFDLLNVEKVCHRWEKVALSVWASKHSFNCSEIFGAGNNIRLDDSTLEIYLKKCPNLKIFDTLDCSHCLSYRCSTATSQHPDHCLTSHSADIIAKFARRLETLNIEKIEITNSGLEMISKNCPELKEVSVHQCWAIGEKGLRSLLTNCQNLVQLEVAANPKFSGQCLERATPNLEKLSVYHCLQFGAWQIISTKCTNLKVLHLANIVPGPNDEQVKAIFQNCTRLESVEMAEFLHSVSPDAMLHVSNLKNLKELYLSHMPKSVTDRVLVEISKNCQQLTALDIGCCFEVTDNGMTALSSLPNLRSLNMEHLKKITSKPLKSIAKRGQLVTLSMISCSMVDEIGIRQVVLLCPNLAQLDISFIRSITTQMVQEYINIHLDKGGSDKLMIRCGGCNVNVANLQLPLCVEVDANDFGVHCNNDAGDFGHGYDDELESAGYVGRIWGWIWGVWVRIWG